MAITDDDDANTKNQADLDLIVGDTTLTVTVTAQDGSTKTYTITVTRTTTITLVSNTGQTLGHSSTSQQSQPFTTGGNLGGYTLTSVDVGLGGTANSQKSSSFILSRTKVTANPTCPTQPSSLR